MTFIPQSPFSRRTQQFITHNNSTIEETSFQSNDLLYINNCNKSEIKLTGARCMKIIIDSNNDSTLTFNINSITTGFVEVMKCNSCKIIMESNCAHKINTLQLDAVSDCEIVFNFTDGNANSLEYLKNFCSDLSIISNIECKNVKLIIRNENGNILFDSCMIFENVDENVLQKNRSSIQFKSKFVLEHSQQLITLENQVVIREGVNGYVSTKKEQQDKEKIQKEFDEKMEKFLRDGFTK